MPEEEEAMKYIFQAKLLLEESFTRYGFITYPVLHYLFWDKQVQDAVAAHYLHRQGYHHQAKPHDHLDSCPSATLYSSGDVKNKH